MTYGGCAYLPAMRIPARHCAWRWAVCSSATPWTQCLRYISINRCFCTANQPAASFSVASRFIEHHGVSGVLARCRRARRWLAPNSAPPDARNIDIQRPWSTPGRAISAPRGGNAVEQTDLGCRIEIPGCLLIGATYHYRWRHGGGTSPVDDFWLAFLRSGPVAPCR